MNKRHHHTVDHPSSPGRMRLFFGYLLILIMAWLSFADDIKLGVSGLLIFTALYRSAHRNRKKIPPQSSFWKEADHAMQRLLLGFSAPTFLVLYRYVLAPVTIDTRWILLVALLASLIGCLLALGRRNMAIAKTLLQRQWNDCFKLLKKSRLRLFLGTIVPIGLFFAITSPIAALSILFGEERDEMSWETEAREESHELMCGTIILKSSDELYPPGSKTVWILELEGKELARFQPYDADYLHWHPELSIAHADLNWDFVEDLKFRVYGPEHYYYFTVSGLTCSCSKAQH